MTRKRFRWFGVLIGLAVLFPAPFTRAEIGPAFAIVKCRIVTGAGPVIEDGTVLIRDGLLDAVGPSREIPLPPDAEVIDGEGKTAYPGLIDAWTSLFLDIPKPPPLGFMQAFTGVPKNLQDDGRHLDYTAFRNLQPETEDRDVYHKLGITTVLSAPEIGYVAGRSVLINLNGKDAAGMVLRNPAALHIQFTPARGVYPTSVMGSVAALRQAFIDAAFYRDYAAYYEQAGRTAKRLPYDPFLEDLTPYALKGGRVMITCRDQEDIKRALRLRDEFGLHAVLTGAEEAWRVADLVEKAEVPLIVSVTFQPPMTSIHFSRDEDKKKEAEEKIYPVNPARLAERGIPFALTTHGLKNKADFFKQIRKALAAGLTKPAALKALTIQPARVLGVDDVLGTLAPGKIANLILTEGGLFEEKTRIERVFVDGLSFEIETPKGETK